MIRYYADGVRMPKLTRLTNRQWIKMVCEKYNRKVGDIVFIFTDEQTITSLNNEFNMNDSATDIITFRYREEDVINGEIFIYLDLVKSNARNSAIPFQEELDRVMIHGILDLCGVRSRTDEEQKIMNKAEKNALLIKTAIHAAKTVIRVYNEETQKYYDRYYIQKNLSNEGKQ